MTLPFSGTAQPRAKRVPSRMRAAGGRRREPAIELLAPDRLPATLAAEWHALAAVASEPNAFAEHWFVMPSLKHLAADTDIRVAIARDEQGELTGLIPLAIRPAYGRIPLRHVQNWLHHNCFLGTPLIRRGDETRFWTVLLAALDTTPWARGLFHVSGLADGGPVHRALVSAALAMGRPCDTVHRVRRAMLASELSPDAYYEANVRKKKRKELGRLANRLGELGEVRYRTLTRKSELAGWIEAFLALERSGWKGKAGSALECDPAVAAFFRESLVGALAARRLDFHRLDLDGRPIAMLVNFLGAPGAFSFKIAFDEAYARYSPGVLIQRYNLRILDRAGFEWMDSCAAEDHPMIDSLWAERRDVVRVSVPLGGTARGMLFRACRSAENASAMVRAARARRGAGNGDAGDE